MCLKTNYGQSTSDVTFRIIEFFPYVHLVQLIYNNITTQLSVINNKNPKVFLDKWLYPDGGDKSCNV